MPKTSRKGLTAKQRGLLNGYMSGLEKDTGADLAERGIGFLFEPVRLPYFKPVTHHTYKGDFFLRRDRGVVLADAFEAQKWFDDEAFWADHFLVETKGRFTLKDRQKHLFIQAQHPAVDIRFLFTRSKSPIRKGSKTTYANWCEKNGFLYADKVVPDEWFDT
ncbi:MAG: endodeoxyribonuclease [Pseudomonadota bacterium]